MFNKTQIQAFSYLFVLSTDSFHLYLNAFFYIPFKDIDINKYTTTKLNTQGKTMKEQQTNYETQDDYYTTVINNIEINIRAYNKTCIHLWINDHNINTEIIDDELSSLKEIKLVLKKNLQLNINLPTLEELLKLQQQYKQGA